MIKATIIFSLTMLLLWPLAGHTQVSNDARFNLLTPGLREWFPGWYITLDGDTVQGYIYLSNQIDNQMNFKYSAENPPGMDVKVMNASVVKGYLVKDRVYESLQIESEKNASLSFIRRFETGRLNLFTWYNLPAVGMMRDGAYERPVTATDEKFHEGVFILKMGNTAPFLVPPSGKFAAVMSAVVADDKVLSQRIADKLKGYRSADLLSIVQQYNTWATSPH